MSANLALATNEFEEKVLKSEVPVLVDFWAEWCGPCRAIAPSVEAIANEYAGRAKVFKVDVDSEQELAIRYGITSIPALLIFKGGRVVDQIIGANPKEMIAATLERHL